uniref:Uncharacterized protein MANES_14G167000 n=1 Tax=Rhizophora mucronata TaxID=61149 RepID=A0A2P2INP7_RHIMU
MLCLESSSRMTSASGNDLMTSSVSPSLLIVLLALVCTLLSSLSGTCTVMWGAEEPD